MKFKKKKKEEERHVWVLQSGLKEVKILMLATTKENGLYSNLEGDGLF